MNHSTMRYAVVAVVVAVAVVIAAMVGLAAGLVARCGGAPIAVAVQRGGATFATTFTLMLATLSLITVWLQ